MPGFESYFDYFKSHMKKWSDLIFNVIGGNPEVLSQVRSQSKWVLRKQNIFWTFGGNVGNQW